MVTYLEWIKVSCGQFKHELSQRHGKASIRGETEKTGIVGCAGLHSCNTRKRDFRTRKIQQKKFRQNEKFILLLT